MATRRITAEAVEKMDPETTIWDSEVRGFGVRRRTRDAVYCVKTRVRGRQTIITIGRHGRGYWGPETARREAIRLLGLIRDGKDPAAERRAAREAPNFADFAARYLAEYAEPHKKPRTVAEDRRQLETRILPALGRMKLGEITKADIARFHHSMRETPVAANRALALISSILGWAERIGERPDGSNPCRHIEKFKEKPRERFLSADEMARLGDALAEAEATGSADWRAITGIRLLLFTGARRSEILTLRWDWIDLDAGVARLPDSKTGAKNLFLSAPALQLLAALPRFDHNPHVLPGDRPGAPFVGIAKPWERIRAAAGLEDVHLHDLRHSFASAAIAAGDALFVVGKLLGHRKATTTERYSHLAADPVRQAADRAAQHVLAMMGNPGSGEVIQIDPKRKGRRSGG